MSGVEAILALVGGAAGGVAAASGTVKAARSAAEEFARAQGWIKQYRAAKKRDLDAKKLLGLRRSGDVVYRSDNVHVLYADQPVLHPDNRRALLAAAGEEYMAAQSNGTLRIMTTIPGNLEDNLVLIGSPTSEGISRLVFGYTPDPTNDDSLTLDAAPLDLPYRMVLDFDHIPERALARRIYEGRGEVVRRNWRIESDRAVYIPELGEDGWLRSDYLLLTRVRNFLTPEGFSNGHSIVSVAGAHGTATRALEVLLKDNAILRRIAEATRGAESSSFQALFRVTDIRHDLERGSWARRIEMVGEPSLIGDSPQRWKVAREVSRDRVQQWLANRA